MSTRSGPSREILGSRGPSRNVAELLDRARAALDRADRAGSVDERFCEAHVSALRTAAAVVAACGRPPSARRKLVSVWVLLDVVAPHLRQWSEYFAASAVDRRAIESGVRDVVTSADADEQLDVSERFLRVVESEVGMLALPAAS